MPKETSKDPYQQTAAASKIAAANANSQYNVANAAKIQADALSPLNQQRAASWTAGVPYPNAPHDGGAQDKANTAYITSTIAKNSAQDYAISTAPTLFDKLALMANIGLATAGAGAVIGPAVSGFASGLGAGATGAGIAGGAATGLAGGAIQSALSGGKVGQNLLTGAVLGGVTGGLQGSGLTQQATGALSNLGVPAPLASGLVKGGIGAGVGAIGGALTGNNIGKSAITGGIGGAANGIVGNLSGNAQLGNIAGTIGGGLAGKYLGSTAPPPVTIAAPAPTAPTSALPALPGTSQANNIGAYSGYGTPGAAGLGYQPRQETNMAGTDWAHYGQGPEQQFFRPTGQAAPQNTAAAQTTPINYNAMPVMSNINQGNITKANSI